ASRGDNLNSIEPYLPPVRTASEVQSTIQGQWILNDLPKAQALAARSGKLVFIDFTGYTCTNCRWMESNIFNRADVGAELSRFVLARLYTDGEGKIYEDQQAFQEKKFGTVALPLYAIVTADGRPLITQGGVVRDSEKFIGFLRAAYSPIALR
ncbi:MAG: thioredoxin family protein, partial [Gemmatimonadaceae bacterium]|nr:thioredoxin family protein [Gemmatimonadaceae bacterium]